MVGLLVDRTSPWSVWTHSFHSVFTLFEEDLVYMTSYVSLPVFRMAMSCPDPSCGKFFAVQTGVGLKRSLVSTCYTC